jgi:spermidine synthase
VRWAARAVLACFFCSGATGLVYEVIWMRMLGLVFGHTVYAVSTVLAAFMGGLALGSSLFGRVADRHRHPVRLYGLLELGIAGFAAATPMLIAAVEWVYLAYAQRVGLPASGFSPFQLALVVGVLAIPTTLMGGTLPILGRFFVTRRDEIGGQIGRLYALNTFGAVGGAYLAGFFLLPGLGISVSLWLVAGVNVAIGLAAILLDRLLCGARQEAPRPAPAPEMADGALPPLPQATAFVVLLVFGTSGAASMMYEVGWTRALSLVLGSSTYAFTTMLVTFLVGLAAGSALFARWWGRRAVPAWSPALIQLGIGLSAALVLPFFDRLPEAFFAVFRITQSPPVILVAQFLLAASVMLVPTLFMGATFPCTVRVLVRGLDAVGFNVGRIYAINTVGAILGTVAAGFLLIPAWGLQRSLLAAMAVNLCGAAVIAIVGLREERRPVLILTALGAMLALIGLPLLPKWNPNVMVSGVVVYGPLYVAQGREARLRDVLPGEGELLYYRDGIGATVSVQRRGEEVFLRVNGKTDANNAGDMRTQLMLAHIPLMLHPAPRQVLVIGLGSGVTAAAAAQHPIEHVDVAEIEPAMIPAAAFFNKENRYVLGNPRVQMHVADGRHFLLTRSSPYDVIISEPSNPWISGIGSLFTVDFYGMAAQRLKADGLYVQWLQAYNLDPDDFRMVIASFKRVFPHAWMWSINKGDFLLLGSRQPLLLDPNRLRARFEASAGVRQDLAMLGMSDPMTILVDFSLGDQDLNRLATGARLNTDDLPLLEFSAPLSLYRQTVQQNNGLVDRTRTRGLPPLAPGADPRLFEQPGFLTNMGLAHVRKGFPVPAKRYLDAALALEPNNPLALLLRGQVNRELGHPLQAEGDLLRLTANEPKSIGGHRELGRLYMQHGMTARAEASFRQMQKLAPDNAEPSLHLAQLYLNQQQWAKAKAEAERAAALAPTNVTAWNLSAQASGGLEDWPATAQALSKGLALAPQDPSLLEQFGRAAVYLGDLAGAERTLRRALEVAPRALEPRLALARVYFHSGNRAGAIRELEAAMRFHPERDDLRDAYEATKTAPLPTSTRPQPNAAGKKS